MKPPPHDHAPPASEASDTSPSRLRLALLCVLLVVVAVFALRPKAASVSGPEKKRPTGASSWLNEVESHMKGVSCRYPDNETASKRARDLPRHIPQWEERARVEPSEYLRAAVRIREITGCDATVPVDQRELIQAAQARLVTQLGQHVRREHALLIRSQKQNDRAAALDAVKSLQRLLGAVEGPTSARLKQLETLYAPSLK